MALIKCKECSHEISDKAKTCPNCGAPVIVKKKSNLGTLIILVLILIGTYIYGKHFASPDFSDETTIKKSKDKKQQAKAPISKPKINEPSEQDKNYAKGVFQGYIDKGIVREFKTNPTGNYIVAMVDPLVWDNLSYDNKKTITIYIANASVRIGGMDKVDIKNYLNNKVLATYSGGWGFSLKD